ncbi:hypothetical protein L3X38_025983 [Prunus dulcis]|uniref:Uncharacterized protein n=1 Tax=Prunus dulcis TaxID=3755 RepID=A0AAD4W2S8_PRUDU|nr:hypothetical protein L3X38_025983 [Prunus dulcis]
MHKRSLYHAVSAQTQVLVAMQRCRSQVPTSILSLTPPLHSQTVGVQNATGTFFNPHGITRISYLGTLQLLKQFLTVRQWTSIPHCDLVQLSGVPV